MLSCPDSICRVPSHGWPHLDSEKWSQINYVGSKMMAIWSDETGWNHRSEFRAMEALFSRRMWHVSGAGRAETQLVPLPRPVDPAPVPHTVLSPSALASWWPSHLTGKN